MIPKNFHFIWISNDLGEDNSLPDKYIYAIKTFTKYNKNYDTSVWLNKDIRKLLEKCPPQILEVINRPDTSLVQKTDIFRMMILREQGGIYCDLDTVCVGNFDDLLKYDFFIGEERSKNESHTYINSVTSPMHYINNTVIGSEPQHKIFEYYFKILLYTKNIYRISYGPNLCEESLFQYFKNGNDKVKILPCDYFFPFTYFEEPSKLTLTQNTKIIHFYGGTGKND